jgi:enoyl-CoA hydratase
MHPQTSPANASATGVSPHCRPPPGLGGAAARRYGSRGNEPGRRRRAAWEDGMTLREDAYTRLKFDWPAERVLRVTFSRPDRLNALDEAGHREITYIWPEINRDPRINAVILTGEGKAFSAGGDFEMIDRLTKDHSRVLELWREARDLVYNILNCDKPIVSAINGPAVGAGLVAGLMSDISIAGRKARIVDGHTRLGVAAGDHAAILWPWLCGIAKAKYYLLTCESLDGEEAERIGLVSKCVDDDALQDEALRVAKNLAEGAQAAIRFTKYSLNNVIRMLGPVFDASTAYEMMGFLGAEGREGVASLQEKRPPRFDPNCPI